MMKTRYVVLIVFAIVTTVSAGALSGGEETYLEVINTLDEDSEVYEFPAGMWKCRKEIDRRMLDPHYEPGRGWKTAAPGYTWVEGGSMWFRTVFRIPEEVEGTPVEGSKVVFHASVNHFGHIYVNGKHENYFRHNKGEALLTRSAVPGEEYVIVMEGINRDGAGIFLDANVTFSALDRVSQEINNYVNRLKTAALIADGGEDAGKWTALLDESAGMVDIEALENGDEGKLLESLGKATAALEPFRDAAKEYTIYLEGHSHLDLAYRWDYRDGETAWINTVDTILKLFDEYPEFTFSQTQAHGYKWLEDDYPELNEKLHEWYGTGRWEVTGGSWSEHDSNLPGGEGLVRQYLYGKRYFREKFGKDVKIAWLPDTFGFNWNLPQILIKSGMTGFFTNKINWNDTTEFPYNIFWWEGADGSRILTYLPVGGTAESVDAAEMFGQMKKVESRHGVKEQLVVFGMGDHGGGVSRTHLNRAFALKDSDVYPKIEFVTGEEYFSRLHELDGKFHFPIWNDELYLEYHRGTYTTQADVKKGNRIGEILQETGEKYASVASLLGRPYPCNRIFDGWYVIMLNHMHDILPGSHIRQVSIDAARDYARQRKIMDGVIEESTSAISARIDTRGEGLPIVIFNPLSWERDAVVELPVTPSMDPQPGVLDSEGRAVPYQVVTDVNDSKSLLFVARGLPAVGYEVYRVAGGMEPAGETDLEDSRGTIENGLLKLEVDMKSGKISGLSLKGGRENFVGDGGANFIQLYEDNPEKYDAWNIGIGKEIPLESDGGFEVVENGPVRFTLKFSKTAGESRFDQYISVYENYPLVEGRIEADWKERHVISKLAFDIDHDSEKCWFEIPYAAIGRAAVAKTPVEKGKWEVPGQKWAECSDAGSAHGIALLNDSKYGFDVNGGMLRMTLLRGPTEPDRMADIGRHTIRYALYPHKKDWRGAAVPRAAHEFNYPVTVRVADSHPGDLPAKHSFFSCGPANVILSAIKQAEDGDGLVVRLFETSGIETTAKIKLPGKVRAVQEINLIEDPIRELKQSGDMIEIPMSHFEIKTLKIKFDE